MLIAVKTDEFSLWLKGLSDVRARSRIAIRIDRLIAGNPGDVEPVGEGVSEMRINYGPGYRVYYMRRGAMLVILLCGGDKSTQKKDIALAKRLARDWKE
ncbi:type II toxin-antitoxin system RelE/ParE family toxin [Rhizobium sp. CSW-27]|uniref:type II toxin-antitoxin system RelE/ParE family toxin n=1 Tax=Rhizobium sp. CSW-27 TaxID=2839985 RepID=UPI001C02496A|nr:type II toxin-antitoxin system RelE/ParE family toxin [Rhizobium sp. CSW-27]MBT9372336.1 type II toxin-antitoxin system RelE/ParE family toxin [Rhizobium sp. CSW-27]